MFASIRSGVLAIGAERRNDAVVPGQLLMVDSAAEAIHVLGTGFLLDHDGHVATARHVLRKLVELQHAIELRGFPPPRGTVLVRTPGFLDPADGLWTNIAQNWPLQRGITFDTEEVDVAIVKIPPIPRDGPLQPLRLSLADVHEGQRIATSGYPHGVRMPMNRVATPTFTSGIVSAITPSAWALPEDRTELVMDATILGGNSGGPVFDVDSGDVIGMVVRNYRPAHRIPGPTGGTDFETPLAVSFIEPAHRIQATYEAAREAWSGLPAVEMKGDSIFRLPRAE